MQEFITVDNAMSQFEKSSGCKMHRDPNGGKCKALGRCRGTLQQEELPCNFFYLSDHLDMLGDMLTRKVNGDDLKEKVKNMVGRKVHATGHEVSQPELLCLLQSLA